MPELWWHDRRLVEEVYMATNDKHFDTADIDVALVRRLVATQFPQWADLSWR